MFRSKKPVLVHVGALLLLLTLSAGQPSSGQSIAPGTGRHSRRDEATVAAKRLAKSAQEANAAEAAASKASAGSSSSARAKAINRVESANAQLRSAAARAATVDPDAAASVINSTVGIDNAISTGTQNSPAQANAAAAATKSAVDAANAASDAISAASTDPTAKLNWLLPTTLAEGGGFVGSNAAVTNAYFNASGPLAFVTKIKYTYNSSTTINTLGGDLIAMQFPYVGFQLALGGNATNNPSSKTNAGSSTTTTASTPTASSVQQAIQKLSQGGDFYLKWTLPVLYTPSNNSVQFQAFTTSVFGFELSGQGAQNTVNTASHSNENFAGEGYFQWDALPDTSSKANSNESLGSIYADARIGWQKLSSGQAANAGLAKTSYRLGQLALGIVFNGYATVSAGRYWGPKQAYVDSNGSAVTVNNFSKWQISVQFNPAVASGKGN